MFNKKTKIIILGVIILFLLVALIFWLKMKDKGAINNDTQSGQKVENSGNENKVAEEAVIKKNLEGLKNNHPEFSASQLESYSNIAIEGNNIEPCLGKDDEGDCISAVAFLTERHDFCSHGFENIEDKDKKIKCANEVLNKTATAEIDKCLSLEIVDFKINCLSGIFGGYEKPEDCSDLGDEKIRGTCEDNAYYWMSVWQGDKKLCDNIKEEYLKNYCAGTGNLTAEEIDSDSNSDIDSDNDGLTDKDETIYGTDPEKADTDGDGFSDGDEVKNGYNPLGEGKLK